MTSENVPRYGFGKNWQDFLDHHLSEERLEVAKSHLLEFLRVDDLSGRRMIDVGCGSGLHSLAALQANVSELFSFDYDANSVAATRRLHSLAGQPAHWHVEQGSVLDTAFLSQLGQFDIVYSWGVLHHTGDQWTAIRNASRLVAPGGLFYIALYTSDFFVNRSPEFWLDVKRRYNQTGRLGRLAIETWYIAGIFANMLRRGENPLTHVRTYKKKRGMSFLTDVRDWLGGWPMEFSSIQQVKDFARDDLKFDLENIATGHSNTEYLFKRPRATT